MDCRRSCQSSLAERGSAPDYTGFRAAGTQDGDPTAMFDLSDDYCSVAYWYQSLPSQPFPALPSREARIADLEP